MRLQNKVALITGATKGIGAEAARLLQQSSALALAIALAILVLQWPLQWLGFGVMGPSPEVLQLAHTYFYIVVWGAPPTLMMMSIKGWLLGMQDSKGAMYISIWVNVANIVASVAWPTRCGWCGAILALWWR